MDQNTKEQKVVEQRFLKTGGLAVLITICSAIAPLSTDMYMPALPHMAQQFHVGANQMNLTLTGFFFAFAVGMLLFGPISDKYGRKPVLIAGTVLYAATSLFCALSNNLMLMVIMRILEALGAGCMLTVAIAIIKDQFRGKLQGTILSVTQTFSGLGPIIAPLIGAFLFRFLGWRAIFIMLTLVAVFILVLCCLMKEPLQKEDRLKGSAMSSYLHIGKILKNGIFTRFMLAIALLQLPMLAYISSSSYIYENTFGLTATQYSLFFAATSITAVVGPMVILAFRNVPAFKLSYIIFIITVAGGIMALIIGHISPVLFAISIAICVFVNAASRPFGAGIVLNLQKDDTGSASAIYNFALTISGGIGMVLITGIFNDYIKGDGILFVLIGIISIIICLILQKQKGRDCLNEARDAQK